MKRRIFYGNDIRERYGCDSTLVKGIASDGLYSGHGDLGQAVGIPECVFSDFRHTLRQIHGDNSACVKAYSPMLVTPLGTVTEVTSFSR